MGSVKRAKCHECGRVMIKKNGNKKYHTSCAKKVDSRQAYESKVRTGKIKHPGVGTGNSPDRLVKRGFKPRPAKCIDCGKGMTKKCAPQIRCKDCAYKKAIQDNRESQARTGRVKNPGVRLRGEYWGEKVGAWKGGSIPWQIENFRGKECERCGSDDEEMHLHHRDRDRANWKNGNLETLCVPCHQEEHRGEVHAAA